jgi:hypothetical protein
LAGIESFIHGYLYGWNNLSENVAMGGLIDLLNYDGYGVNINFDV